MPLEPAEYELTTVVAGERRADRRGGPRRAAGSSCSTSTLDDALRAEGYARDVVRAVQDARKAAGLQVGDRIVLTLDVPAEHVAAVEAHRDTIARETLAVVHRRSTTAPDAARSPSAAVEAGGYEA